MLEIKLNVLERVHVSTEGKKRAGVDPLTLGSGAKSFTALSDCSSTTLRGN